MNTLAHSQTLEPGQKTTIRSDREARYEVVLGDGSIVEFTAHAGQDFSITAGTGGGPINVNMYPSEIQGADTIHLVASAESSPSN